MDIIKAEMHAKCGPGGLYCPCCNKGNKGKFKPKMGRALRRAAKQIAWRTANDPIYNELES